MSRQERKQNNGGKGGNKSVVIVAAIAIVIIAVLVGVIVFLLKPQEEEKRNVVITPENVEEVLEELEEEGGMVEPGYYTVTMDTTWHFANGNEPSYDAMVLNVETNTNDVYFDIVLESDESMVLYESPVIPRGGRLENIALDKDLDAGTYNCVVIYHLIDENQNTISTLRVTLKIVIEG